MMVMERNRWRRAWWSTKTLAPLYDGDGYETGESTVTWSEPVAFRCNAAPPKGDSVESAFGTDVRYDLVMVLNAGELGIAEGDRLWLDPDEPSYDKGAIANVSKSYRVERVSPSEHYVAYALSSAKGE